MTSTASAALAYASSDLAVLPVNSETKAPLTKHGVKDASADADVISEWWRGWPAAGVAIATGASRVVVIDVDPRNGGDQTLNKLLSAHGQLPETWTASTPGNGEGRGTHYYFQADVSRLPPSGLGPGVDVLSGDKYAVAAPSSRGTGAYRWLEGRSPAECELAELPSWILNREPLMPMSEAGANVDLGQRNTFLFTEACALYRRGISDTGKVIAELQRLNLSRCNPPLDSGEVDKIAAQAGKYTRRKAAPRFSLHTLDELEPTNDIEWLVQGLLRRGGFGVLYGAPDVGKTFVAVHMALCVATGASCFGREVMAGPIVFATEDLPDLRNRIEAWQDVTGIAVPPNRFRYLEGLPQLVQRTEMEELTRLLLACADEPALLVIDTLSRCLPGQDESAVAVMSAVVDNLHALSETTGVTTLLIHHSLKGSNQGRGDQKYRGNNALEAGSTLMLKVERGLRGSGDLLLKAERVRSWATVEPWPVSLVASRGTLVVNDKPDRSRVTGRSNPRTDYESILLECMQDLSEAGEAVDVQTLRERFVERTSLSVRSFSDVRKRLVDSGQLVAVGRGAQARYVLPAAAAA